MSDDEYDDNLDFTQAVAAQERDAQRREEELLITVTLGTALIFFGIEESRRLRSEYRSERRLYLTRPELIEDPRGETPWKVLHRSRNDRAFITTMGFDVKTFELILASGFRALWNTTPVPREDVSSTGTPRLSSRTLDAAGGLGLILHFLNSTMTETNLVQIFAIVPSSCSRYLSFCLSILLSTVRKMQDCRVQWLNGDEFEERNRLVVERHPLLTGAFGVMDGLNLPVQTSTDVEIENATYNGWLHEHFVSCVIAFCAQGEIIACRLNCPGSWHDSRVAGPIYEKLRDSTPEGWYLVADTAFPRGTQQIDGRIKVPIKDGSHLPRDPIERARVKKFDDQLVSFRQAAEWGMRAFQGSFSRLKIPLQIQHDDMRGNLLEVCVRLFNLRTRQIGFNQIQSVYLPIWKDEDGAAWNSFENMVFGDLRRHDRVRRFHLAEEDD